MQIPAYYDFKKLNLEDQIQVLTNVGTYLAWKRNGEYNIYLYKLDDFFAEAWMNVKIGKIMKIDCSNDSNLPGGYAKQIKIN